MFNIDNLKYELTETIENKINSLNEKYVKIKGRETSVPKKVGNKPKKQGLTYKGG